MRLKPGRKIIINKAEGTGSPKRPVPSRKHPSFHLPPQEETSSVWVICGIVALIVAALVGAVSVGVARSEKEPAGEASTSGGGTPVRQENLWMGKWMKGRETPEALRARQERVRRHDARRDGT